MTCLGLLERAADPSALEVRQREIRLGSSAFEALPNGGLAGELERDQRLAGRRGVLGARGGTEDGKTARWGVLEEVRELSRGLHPALLSRGGLGPSLRALGRKSPIRVDLDIHTDERPPQSVEIGVYFVVSEVLTNAAKHSQASAISVSVRAEDTALSVKSWTTVSAARHKLGNRSHRAYRPRGGARGTTYTRQPGRWRNQNRDRAATCSRAAGEEVRAPVLERDS